MKLAFKAAILATACAAFGAQAQDRVIRVGVLMPISGPGSYFGELSVLDGQRRTATIVATSVLETWSIAEFNFRALLKEHPTVALKLLGALSTRLRTAERSLVS